LIVLDWNQSF